MQDEGRQGGRVSFRESAMRQQSADPPSSQHRERAVEKEMPIVIVIEIPRRDRFVKTMRRTLNVPGLLRNGGELDCVPRAACPWSQALGSWRRRALYGDPYDMVVDGVM